MKEAEEKAWRDILTGEAVVILLMEKSPVSWRTIRAKLGSILDATGDAEKKKVVAKVIQEIEADMRAGEAP